MSAIGDLVATLGMNIQPFQAAAAAAPSLANQMAQRITQATGRVRGALANVLSGVGLGSIGGLLAGGLSMAGIYESVAKAGEAAREQKKLGVILESTGAAAIISAREINVFGEQLQKTTNYSREMAVSAASALAPFSRGMSGDMFKGVLKAAADVGSVMGGDLPENARKIGMAMQYPERAMRLLRPLGIQFTEEQKKQLELFKKQGNAAGAQGIILSAVNAKFAGDAEKMASQLTQLKNRLSEIGISIGSAILPYVKQLAAGFMSAIDYVQQFGASVISYTAPARAAIWAIVEPIWAFAQAVASNPIVQAVVGWVAGINLVAVALAGLAVAVPAIGTAFSAVAATIGGAITVAMGPIGAVVAAVLGIGAAVVWCVGTGDTFGERFTSVLGTLAEYAKSFADTMAFAFRNFGDLAQVAIINVVLAALEMFPQMQGPIQAMAAAFVGTWAGIKAFFASIIESMIGGLKELMNFGKAVGEAIAAGWTAITSGNFEGAAGAMADAFVKELASQQDVNAKNALSEFSKAYSEAAGNFTKNVTQSGGMTDFLKQQREGLLKGIGENETAIAAIGQKKKTEASQPQPAYRPPETPKAMQSAAYKEKDLPKALELGTDEAWKSIINQMYGNKDDATKEIAKNTERTADGISDLRDAILESSDAEVGI